MTIVGTRPEIIKLSRVIHELDKFTDHILVHTGQNYDYELNEIFFDDFDLKKPDIYLNAVGKNASDTIGNIISKTYEQLTKIKPDAFLVLGDTNSCLSAISAKKLQIPVFHIEAGNRCFDQRVPEESNRKIVDSISDINITYSDIAREHLISEGHSADRVIKVGSPMKEVLNYMQPKYQRSEILARLKIKPSEYFLVSAHREENVSNEKNFNRLINSLKRIYEKYSLPIIVSTHPRTMNVILKNKISLNKEIIFLKPFSFSDYINLQINSLMVLSDSGTISEESSILGFNALNIREAHERPEAIEEGALIMTGLDEDRILQAIEVLKSQNQSELNIVKDYDIDNVSLKIERIILSYTNYINQKVWFK